MSSNELGDGLSLDNNWDLVIDEQTGDVAFERGSGELQKDLAFNLALELTGRVGAVPTQGQLRDIEQVVRRVVLDDSRIDTVSDLTVEYIARQQELEIAVQANAVSGVDIDQIFTVPLTQP